MLSRFALNRIAASGAAKAAAAGPRFSQFRFLSVASTPPPPAPAKSPHGEDPDLFEPSREEKRLHNRTYQESEYKLGKHRSNALELIEQVPIVEVEGEMAICDGGGGPLGHPLEYISLQRPHVVERCKYCGLRFKSKAWEDH